MILSTMSSCSTQSFTINGIPGTVISSKNGEEIAIIDQTGQANIVFDNKQYCHFLLAKSPNSNTMVPFALDYKDNNRNGRGNTLGAIGAPAMVAGFITCIVSGNIPSAAALVVPGVIGVVLGVSFTVTAATTTGQLNNYDYLPNQITNNDLFNKE